MNSVPVELQGDEPLELESEKLLNLHERTSYHENYLRDLFRSISDYAVYTSDIRNAIDDIAISLRKYAIDEDFKTTSKLAYSFISNNLLQLGDAKHIQCERLEAKILENLDQHGRNCKLMKRSIKKSLKEKKREIKKIKVVRRYRKKLEDYNGGYSGTKLSNRAAKAEKSYSKAMYMSEKVNSETNEEMYLFEKKRHRELQEILRNFFMIELSYHAKAIEICSESFRQLKSIDSRDDLEVISTGLRIVKNRGFRRLKSETYFLNQYQNYSNNNNNSPDIIRKSDQADRKNRSLRPDFYAPNEYDDQNDQNDGDLLDQLKSTRLHKRKQKLMEKEKNSRRYKLDHQTINSMIETSIKLANSRKENEINEPKTLNRGFHSATEMYNGENDDDYYDIEETDEDDEVESSELEYPPPPNRKSSRQIRRSSAGAKGSRGDFNDIILSRPKSPSQNQKQMDQTPKSKRVSFQNNNRNSNGNGNNNDSLLHPQTSSYSNLNITPTVLKKQRSALRKV